jgi:predicted DCC family thiol-disulfide oxidoreductase YuxK
MKEIPSKLVVFDGECGLCNFCVKMVIRFDKKGEFFITPLSGEMGQHILQKYSVREDAALYLREGALFTGADCVLECLSDLGGVPRVFSKIFFIFPKKIRDSVYGFVGKYRYSLFGTPRVRVCNMLDDSIQKRLV